MSEQWGGARSAMESAQPEPQAPSTEQQMAGVRLEMEFASAYPQWAGHHSLERAAVAVAKAAQERGDDLGLFDPKVGHLNRAEFFSDLARELEAEHSVSGQLRKMQGRRR